MAFLLSLGYAPATLISLFAGVLIDRVRRRPVMILVDLLSVVLLLLIPVLALRGWLNMAALYGVSFLLSVAGASTMCLGLAAALLGTALGGVLGEHVGIPATIVIGAIGGTFSFVWLVFSPIRQLHDLDDVS
jgi:predicted MFS family arabinose efflux permease